MIKHPLSTSCKQELFLLLYLWINTLVLVRLTLYSCDICQHLPPCTGFKLNSYHNFIIPPPIQFQLLTAKPLIHWKLPCALKYKPVYNVLSVFATSLTTHTSIRQKSFIQFSYFPLLHFFTVTKMPSVFHYFPWHRTQKHVLSLQINKTFLLQKHPDKC